MAHRLRLTGIAKAFGATRALKNVTLEVAPGEVHALIGENGAGKSTLMKVLSGAHRPDGGTVELDGRPFTPRDPLHARRCGVSMIYQELTLAPHLSVEENILLGDEPTRFGWIKQKHRRELARAALAELHADHVPLNALASDLSIAQQQLVEIARALLSEPKVLIMDEPTSSLPHTDAEHLFGVIAGMKSRGVAVIYISHFLEECARVCDRYTVLRDGANVATGEMASASAAELIQHMVGRAVDELYPRIPHAIGEPLLEVRGIAGKTKPRNVTFTLRRGEILGIAGLIGAGRTETLRAMFGLDPLKAGRVEVSAKDGQRRISPRQRWADGIGLLSENRKEEGLMLGRTIAENLLLTCYERVSCCGVISARAECALAADAVRMMELKAASSQQAVQELSGGNQQKVALGRLLVHDARILLLDEPTRGIDVASKASIYQRIGEAAAAGHAVVFVSSYLPELLGICDTIGVMCRGVLSAVRPASAWSEHEIIATAIAQNSS
jgi:ribose transport system ATP-binding protein